ADARRRGGASRCFLRANVRARRGRAQRRLARTRPCCARGGVRGRRGIDCLRRWIAPPLAAGGARAVHTRRWTQPIVHASTRLSVALAAAATERRGARTTGVAAGRRRALALRREDHAQTSTAIWSSTRVNTQAPSARATNDAMTR